MGAGVDAVNISLDTLDPAMYASVARRDCLAAALEGLEAAAACPGLKVKINCVPLRGINENQWIRLAGIAEDRPIDVRFIEMMPVGLGQGFPRQLPGRCAGAPAGGIRAGESVQRSLRERPGAVCLLCRI